MRLLAALPKVAPLAIGKIAYSPARLPAAPVVRDRNVGYAELEFVLLQERSADNWWRYQGGIGQQVGKGNDAKTKKDAQQH